MPRRRKVDPTYREYDPNFHPQDLLERMSRGEFNVQVIGAWHISEASFYRWRHEHPELEEAYQQGLPACEKWWIENKFIPMTEGKLEGRHSFNATMAMANAKFNYRRNEEGSSRTTNINVQNMNVLAGKSIEELSKLVNDNLSFLAQNNVIEAKYKELDSPNDSESDEQDL